MPPEPGGRDRPYWANPVGRLNVVDVPPGAVSVTVQGRRVNGPMQGFGKMWQKTFRVRLTGAAASPREVIRTWKEQFPAFWPPGASFYAPLAGIAPGEIALLSLSPVPRNPLRLSTGVRVIYADEESFTVMSPEGPMLAAWITFSAGEEDGVTVVQAQALERANDPLYELGTVLAGHGANNRFWESTLRALAAHFGVDGQVETRVVCVDPRRQWSRLGNVWHNAAVRSLLDVWGAPLRWAGRSFRRTTDPVR
jgi:hypothetical protein